ncbi:MAG: Smr/MutS family protein [Erysipelotrichaceae bacterium]
MNSYEEIDLLKVKENVSEFAFIEDAKSFIMNEEVVFNPLHIKRKINETEQMLKLIREGLSISFDGIENIGEILDKASRGINLNSIECSKVLNFHNHCKRIKELFKKYDHDLDIFDYIDTIEINEVLSQNISKVVDNSGNIKEDASKKLSDIFRKISINDKNLFNQATVFINRNTSSLQENSFYYRNGRLTFLVKISDKNKFRGYTYGTSASGLAAYVEPESFINLNNEKINLEEDREAEVIRLLHELSAMIGDNASLLMNNYDSIVKLDVIYSKAQYGFNNNGVCASIGNVSLCLKDIVHPLIDPKKVVSNTYTLNKPYQGIVISGTNTGGKTVSLKVIGLSVLMSYLGIPLLCAEAHIPFYSSVYVDIDDNQSVLSSLSTFSAHLSNIDNILNKADNKSLILIDELISGTDPKEAQAISLAILKKILKLGSAFVITTHYDDIKNFSYENENILLSAVGFDNEKLKPTYKYIENSVGLSNAIDIAQRYLSDEKLVEDAREIIKKKDTKTEELMKKLSQEIALNEKLKEELDIKIQENNKLINEYNQKISDFENEKIKLRNEYLEKLNEEIEEIKNQALEKLESIQDVKQIETVKEISSLKKKTAKHETVKKTDDHFEVNDSVRIKDGEQIGTILKINGKRVDVNINGLIIKTELKYLTKMPKIKKKEVYVSKINSGVKASKELNIVGERVDDALVRVESFLDEALLAGYDSVKIIHGIGTGQLRNAVRNKLKKLKFVKSFGDGDYYDGASAVTMVNLK